MASKEPMPRYFFRRTPLDQKYSPGASVVPANNEPIMTEREHQMRTRPDKAKPKDLPQEAPNANAFVMCPTAWIPPSAIVGTPLDAAYLETR